MLKKLSQFVKKKAIHFPPDLTQEEWKERSLQFVITLK